MSIPKVTVVDAIQNAFKEEPEESSSIVAGFYSSPLVSLFGKTGPEYREKEEGVMFVSSLADWTSRLRIGGFTGPTGDWAYDWWCVNNYLKYGGTCIVGGTGSESYIAYSSDGTPLHSKKYEIDIIFASTGSQSTAVAYSVANTREDCLAIVGTTFSAQINTNLSASAWSHTNNQYFVNVYGHKRFYDDTAAERSVKMITIAPDVAGCFARSFRETNPWEAPAGFVRGKILDVINLVQSVDLKSTFGQTINTLNANIVTTFPGKGVYFITNNTSYNNSNSILLKKINTMLLVNYIKKKVTPLAQDFLFEINNQINRDLFITLVDNILREIQATQSITDYKIVCDASNNPDSIVDANKFVADIYIKIGNVAETINVKITPIGDTSSGILGSNSYLSDIPEEPDIPVEFKVSYIWIGHVT